MTFFRLDNKWLIWPLFLCLMSYAVLRAWFVEPLFDELATLYWYIQTGYLPGRGATMDANNHILNSLVSHQFFQLFGDRFMAYRLFALSTFPIYFFACRKFLLKSATSFSFILFLALVSIHWIFDYFSFSRGYGPSLAFLMLSFCFIQKWLETFNTTYFIAITFSFIAALLCNLSLLIPLFILTCYCILCSFVYIKQMNRKQLLGFWICTLAFLTFLVPVYIYINKLKKAGALWWGSTESLWEVTGKSLTENVFFSTNELWKYFILILFCAFFILFLRSWKNAGLKDFICKDKCWIPGLFGVTLISLVLMARLMNVNYPMDRVGMYLIPLFILVFGLLFQDLRSLRWSLLLLLWFPLSFVYKLNLNTSVFSPEDRIHRAFFEKIQKTVPGDASISADYVSQASYAYLSRQQKIPHIVTDFIPTDSLTRGEYHISWVDELNWTNYTCLFQDPVSKTRLYKRNTPFQKILLLDTFLYQIKSNQAVIPVLSVDLRSFTGQYLQTIVDGEVQLGSYCLDLNLRHEIQHEIGELRRSDNTRFNWYFGRKRGYQFHYPNHPIFVQPGDKSLLIQFYNDDLKQIHLSRIHLKVYRIK